MDYARWRCSFLHTHCCVPKRYLPQMEGTGCKLDIRQYLFRFALHQRKACYRLNNYWVYYFIALGAINLVVAFTLSEAAWIQFKVFGNLVLTFIFVFAQMPLFMKYIEVEEDDNSSDSATEESI